LIGDSKSLRQLCQFLLRAPLQDWRRLVKAMRHLVSLTIGGIKAKSSRTG